MKRAASWGGYPCPEAVAAGEDHGQLIPGREAGGGWQCPNQAHDGRPKSHPLGEAAPTRFRFTTAEAEAAGEALAARRGAA